MYRVPHSPSGVLKCSGFLENVFGREEGNRGVVRIAVCTQWGELESRFLP